MKVIIGGGRDFGDYELVQAELNLRFSDKLNIETISGRCSDKKGVLTFTTSDGIKVYGADGLGERWAKEKGITVHAFPADWNTHGKYAGPIRNKVMAMEAEALIAFWDGKSKGTKNMIDTARKQGLEVYVINYAKKKT